VEAIIGAAYKSGGREVALRASKALCIAIPRVDRWADFAKQALAPPPEVTGKLRAGTVEAIEKILGHRFARPHLLAQALVRLLSWGAIAGR
jgi:endoribonuclease Dicer